MNDLKYLKDYENSTDYELFMKLLDSGKLIATETINMQVGSCDNNFGWSYKDNSREFTYYIAGVFIQSSEGQIKERVIRRCKELNLHFVIPNRGN